MTPEGSSPRKRRLLPETPTYEPPTSTRSTAKLEQYESAKEPLETFLARFENFSRYFHWSENDRLFNLCNSLGKGEAQILWDGGVYHTADDLKALLRKRFGSEDQTERSRLELRNRRRKKNETLQELYQDIKRLLAQAHQGETGPAIESLGIDSFLEAFGDRELRKLVMQKGCKTMDEALTVAMRMEAIEITTRSDVPPAYGADGQRLDRAHARIVAADPRTLTLTSPVPEGASWWRAQSAPSAEMMSGYAFNFAKSEEYYPPTSSPGVSPEKIPALMDKTFYYTP